MSRVLELIKRYVSDVGHGEAGVQSFRLSNDPRGEDTHAIIRMTVSFKGRTFDKTFRNSLMGAGIYVDDTFILHRPDGRAEVVRDLSEVNHHDGYESMEIGFSCEKKPITGERLIKTLQANTIFGLPADLYRNFPIAKLQIFFGVNKSSLNLLRAGHHELRVYQSHPFVIEHTRSPFMEFIHLDERFNLASVRRPIAEYVGQELAQLLARHAYAPKVGLKISSLFPAAFFSSTSPLSSWDFIRHQVDSIVHQDLTRHTRSQVNRISRRVGEVGRRKKILHNGIDLGLVPINEVETVLLFQRIALSYPNMLPGGLRVSLLDYSPKDIDSICCFQLTHNHPEETGPVEFEFSLASFFKHGHDYRQVKLIICYTSSPLSFPYTHGGIIYELDKSGNIPRLTNRADHSSIPCLILEELFK